MKKIILSAIIAASALTSVASHAANKPETAQFQVKITVAESCKITTKSDVDFSVIDRSTNVDSIANGQLNVICTLNTPYEIALAGTGAMSNINKTSQSKVPYKLYQDAARKTEWGATANNKLVGAGTGNDQAIPVYAKLDGNTNVEAGNYVDTVVATVTY